MIKKSQRERKILPTWEFTARGEEGEEGEGHGALQAPFTMLLPSLSISRLEIPSIFFSLPLPFFFIFFQSLVKLNAKLKPMLDSVAVNRGKWEELHQKRLPSQAASSTSFSSSFTVSLKDIN